MERSCLFTVTFPSVLRNGRLEDGDYVTAEDYSEASSSPDGPFPVALLLSCLIEFTPDEAYFAPMEGTG